MYFITDYGWLSILLYVSGTFFSSISMRIVYVYTSELFPTYTRNTMHALCSALGRVSAIIAPQTPLLMQYWPGLPSMIMGILSILTACVVTLLPDTSDEVLPDNVGQAEAVGKKEKNNFDFCSKL
nr:solute carrier family 22 member 1 [Helicoverpa armigera]